MITLYRPVLIESAEQAEALPLFTIATIEDSPVTGYPEVARKIVNGWRNRDLVDGRIPHTDMIGWTALVPIKAEEEWTPMVNGHAYVNGKKSEAHVRATVAEWPGAKTGHRLVTLWEEA